MHALTCRLSAKCGLFVHCYPNAGLPNPLAPTGYDEKPADTARALFTFADEGLLNMAVVAVEPPRSHSCHS